jgi:transcriptional regulator with XRE-family HTH domain
VDGEVMIVDGARVRRLRTELRLTLTVVAQEVGISPSYLSMIERGLRPVVSKPVVVGLAAALGVEVRRLQPGLRLRPAP